MKRIGVFGGTFSPPHIGHVGAATAFLKQAKLDLLYIIPAGIPPHKNVSGGVPAYTRLQMTKIMFTDSFIVDNDYSSKAYVSDYEIKKESKSYTVETLRYIKSNHADSEIFLLCGTDMFLSLDTWYMPQEIFILATIALTRRENDIETSKIISEKTNQYKEQFGGKVLEIDLPIVELSSSQIREKLKSGEDVSKYISQSLMEYIKVNNIY